MYPIHVLRSATWRVSEGTRGRLGAGMSTGVEWLSTWLSEA